MCNCQKCNRPGLALDKNVALVRINKILEPVKKFPSRETVNEIVTELLAYVDEVYKEARQDGYER